MCAGQRLRRVKAFPPQLSLIDSPVGGPSWKCFPGSTLPLPLRSFLRVRSGQVFGSAAPHYLRMTGCGRDGKPRIERRISKWPSRQESAGNYLNPGPTKPSANDHQPSANDHQPSADEPITTPRAWRPQALHPAHSPTDARAAHTRCFRHGCCA